MGNEIYNRALRLASRLVLELPEGTVWSICLTNEDTELSPGVFNIFVENESQRVQMRNMLGFSVPDDINDTFESYKYHPVMLVSIIEPEREESNE